MMFDLAVIGGGPGGYVAAIKAAQLGAKVLLAEKAELGGVCLNRGCIPTKTLLASAAKWQELQHLEAYGLRAENIAFDFAAVQRRKNEVVGQMRGGVEQLLKKNGVEIVCGSACLMGPQSLRVSFADGGDADYQAKSIILASGSQPMRLPIPGGDLPGVLDSTALLSLEAPPQRLAVIGGGAVGIEFAAIFRAFGSEVTVLEMLPNILPNIDDDLVKRMGLVMRKAGIKLLSGTRLEEIRAVDGALELNAANAKGAVGITADIVLVAAGRRPVLDGLGLDAAGVVYGKGGVAVDPRLATNVPTIYAIGDLTGRQMLAHAASAAALVAVENALGGDKTFSFDVVPACVFTTPEIASVGLTEQAAREQGLEVKTSRFNFAGNGKAIAQGETDGLVKIIADAASGKLLGMHIMGAHASDLIMEGALAMQNGLSAAEIASTIHPHPSLSETVLEAAHGIDGPMIHQLKL